jgi:putative methionine-R-sulfoxide reductase with GAF domain
LSRTVARSLAQAVDAETPREERACAAAEIVRKAGAYRWVGIYDVGDEEIVLLGQTGPTAPAHARFAVTRGLSGEAVRTRLTVVSNDVGSGSETIVPILGPESGIVIGTLNVEQDRTDAFSRADVAFLEECAAVLRPLYE